MSLPRPTEVANDRRHLNNHNSDDDTLPGDVIHLPARHALPQAPASFSFSSSSLDTSSTASSSRTPWIASASSTFSSPSLAALTSTPPSSFLSPASALCSLLTTLLEPPPPKRQKLDPNSETAKASAPTPVLPLLPAVMNPSQLFPMLNLSPSCGTQLHPRSCPQSLSSTSASNSSWTETTPTSLGLPTQTAQQQVQEQKENKQEKEKENKNPVVGEEEADADFDMDLCDESLDTLERELEETLSQGYPPQLLPSSQPVPLFPQSTSSPVMTTKFTGTKPPLAPAAVLPRLIALAAPVPPAPVAQPAKPAKPLMATFSPIVSRPTPKLAPSKQFAPKFIHPSNGGGSFDGGRSPHPVRPRPTQPLPAPKKTPLVLGGDMTPPPRQQLPSAPIQRYYGTTPGQPLPGERKERGTSPAPPLSTSSSSSSTVRQPTIFDAYRPKSPAPSATAAAPRAQAPAPKPQPQLAQRGLGRKAFLEVGEQTHLFSFPPRITHIFLFLC